MVFTLVSSFVYFFFVDFVYQSMDLFSPRRCEQTIRCSKNIQICIMFAMQQKYFMSDRKIPTRFCHFIFSFLDSCSRFLVHWISHKFSINRYREKKQNQRIYSQQFQFHDYRWSINIASLFVYCIFHGIFINQNRVVFSLVAMQKTMNFTIFRSEIKAERK